MTEKLATLKSPGYLLRFLLLVVMPLVCIYQIKDLSSGSMIFPLTSCLIILGIGIKQALFFPQKLESNEVANFKILLKVLAALLLFCGLLDIIGFYADIFLLSCFFYLHFDMPLTWKKAGYAVLTSLIITVSMLVFFRYALQLIMPEGIFFDA